MVNYHDPLVVAVKTLIAKGIANTEFDPQRETLKQAEIPSSSSFTPWRSKMRFLPQKDTISHKPITNTKTLLYGDNNAHYSNVWRVPDDE